ncbi:SDR family oxidoreductase [Nocardia jiangxiensis]|uniref:SDR family oxidoreductase n=1 Tax=Nocardia jiangxiensis TaxID=282685 RepID=A0ABW6SDZ6_9NOCA
MMKHTDAPRSAKVVLVTGASSGLGLSIATHLQEAGYRVYGTSRRADGQRNAYGAFSLIPMDVTDDASVAAAIDTIISREGVLDVVICNAGMGLAGSIEDTTIDEAQLQFDTNFFGVHRVCRAALPSLRQRSTSSIIVVGSIAGVFGIPFQGFYAASKFALEGYVESLRLELRKTGVKATIVEPGSFRTEFTSGRVVIKGAGEGSFYRQDFANALALMEKEERDATADVGMLCTAVGDLLEMDRPPIRIAVGLKDETDLATRKHEWKPEELEQVIAESYGL